jgi:hypothetical protein
MNRSNSSSRKMKETLVQWWRKPTQSIMACVTLATSQVTSHATVPLVVPSETPVVAVVAVEVDHEAGDVDVVVAVPTKATAPGPMSLVCQPLRLRFLLVAIPGLHVAKSALTV